MTNPHLNPKAKQRVVVCAANRVDLGSGHYQMVLGPRHFDPTMREAIGYASLGYGGATRDLWRTSEQGFIDQRGTFMDRGEAFQVAKAAGQLRYGPHLPGEQLDSSDLY